MTMIDLLDRGLFAIGELLRGPVIILLWACVVFALALAGSTAAESVARRRERLGFDLRGWSPASARRTFPRVLARFHQEALALPAGPRRAAWIEECLTRYETMRWQAASGPRLLVKIGPSLGLLGTLLPMGSALATLSNGNLEAMSGQMISAFTSTVIGLATGTLAFVIAAWRTSWIVEDIRELRLVADLLLAEVSDATA